MTTPTPDPKVEQLLHEGMAAARAGDKETARTKLRELVALDQYNEKGWFWLASVAESIEERRVCLGNVVVINPDNEKAKQMLEQISFGAFTSPFSTADDAQSQKATLRTIAIVGGVVVVLLALVLIIFGGGGADQPTPTFVMLDVSGTDESVLTRQAATLLAIVTQTAAADLTRIARQLPPTWTPSPPPTPRGGFAPTALPSLPFTLEGRLIVQYGTPLTRDGYLPMFLYDLATGTQTPLTERERGDYGRFVPDGRRFIYARLVSGARPQLLFRIANLNGSQPQELSAFWRNRPPLADQAMLSIARNGEGVAFIARNITGENDSTSDVYYLPLRFASSEPSMPTPPPTPTPEGSDATPEPTATPTPEPSLGLLQVRRVTARDSGVNTWAAISPDGTQIAFVSDRTDIGGRATDLYVVPVNEQFAPEVALTEDGSDLIESAPSWSPNGKQIAFAAGAAAGGRVDLFVINADGSNRRVLVEDFGECARPLWSPDGEYIIFSGKRGNKWELYVVVIESGELYQLTQTEGDVIIATDWGN